MITNYKDLNINDIMEWCHENGEVKWLKEKAKETRPFKVYPRVEKDGKMVADKSQEPIVEMRPISFIQLKKDFAETFMADILPLKQKKPTMYEMIEAMEE